MTTMDTAMLARIERGLVAILARMVYANRTIGTKLTWRDTTKEDRDGARELARRILMRGEIE